MKRGLLLATNVAAAVIVLTGAATIALDAAAQLIEPQAAASTGLNAYMPEYENQNIPDAFHPIDKFDGWSQLYKSYDKSPILFDSMRTGKTRKYPQLSYPENISPNHEFSGDDLDKARNSSLKRLNLGVDDEIAKTSMTVYQPIFALSKESARDEFDNGNYLQLFNSKRGIANLTLSYLDKTVAAGLATTQQQVDQKVSQHLLKQIAWASARMANPEKSQVYVDTDEKVEACMATGGSPKLTYPWINMPNVGDLRGPCVSCFQVEGGGITTPTRGAGLYSYCVCCSEIMSDMNWTTTENTLPAKWSLIDRVIYGTNKGPGPVIRRQYLDIVVSQIRFLYGDVEYAKCNRFAAEPDKDKDYCVENKLEYKVPDFSVPDKIKLFRDGMYDPDCSAAGSGCPITGTPIKEGICPALEGILCKLPELKGNMRDRLKELWVQASLGTMLTSADFDNMEKLIGEEELAVIRQDCSIDRLDQPGTPGTKMSWGARRPSDAFRMWLDRFCDAAAVSAFKKYHARVASIVEDHLMLNRRVTEQDRVQMRELMGRVSTDIRLAEMDRGATEAPDRILAGLSLDGGRRKSWDISVAKESLDDANRNAQINNALTVSSGYRDQSPKEVVTSVISFP